jgi:hypothetical protein
LVNMAPGLVWSSTTEFPRSCWRSNPSRPWIMFIFLCARAVSAHWPSAFYCVSAPDAVTPLHGPPFAAGLSLVDRKAEDDPGRCGR